MLITYLTRPFLSKGFTLDETIDIMADAGFTGIDFSFHYSDEFCCEETDSEMFKTRFIELRNKAESRGLVFDQAHAPVPSSNQDDKITEKTFYNIVRSIRNASYLGIPVIVVHPCQHLAYCNDGVPEQLYEINMKFYNKLKPYAEEYGVKIAVENMWQQTKGGNINHSTCSCPDEFIKYVDSLDRTVFTACLDIGHAHLVRSNPSDFIRKLGADRLGCLHIHDVDGIKDSHTMPFLGNVDWMSVCKALKDIEYKGNFTYEATWIVDTFPRELVSDGCKMLVSTAKHLISMING